MPPPTSSSLSGQSKKRDEDERDDDDKYVISRLVELRQTIFTISGRQALERYQQRFEPDTSIESLIEAISSGNHKIAANPPHDSSLYNHKFSTNMEAKLTRADNEMTRFTQVLALKNSPEPVTDITPQALMNTNIPERTMGRTMYDKNSALYKLADDHARRGRQLGGRIGGAISGPISGPIVGNANVQQQRGFWDPERADQVAAGCQLGGRNSNKNGQHARGRAATKKKRINAGELVVVRTLSCALPNHANPEWIDDDGRAMADERLMKQIRCEACKMMHTGYMTETRYAEALRKAKWYRCLTCNRCRALTSNQPALQCRMTRGGCGTEGNLSTCWERCDQPNPIRETC